MLVFWGEQMKNSIVGDLIGKRGIVYAPVNRAGVLMLFSRLLDEFEMLIEQISDDCSYVIALRRIEYGWERIKISLAFKSSDLNNGSSLDGDLLICWHHDWSESPLKTFELKALFDNSHHSDSNNHTKAFDENNNSTGSVFQDVISSDSGELLLRRGVTQRRFEKAISELDNKIKNIFPENS